MSSFDDLLSQVPIAQIADKLGVDEATATDAVHKALPALLGGLQAKAGNSQSEQSVQGLVDQHQDDELLSGGVDMHQVDVGSGEKIVDDVFGSDKNTVINALGATGDGAGGNDLIAKVLPMLAPIVMAYLSRQMLGGKGATAGTAEPAAAGGGLGDLLGGLLGGAGKSGGIGGALSEALGKNAGSTIGNVLGGLFGKR